MLEGDKLLEVAGGNSGAYNAIKDVRGFLLYKPYLARTYIQNLIRFPKFFVSSNLEKR